MFDSVAGIENILIKANKIKLLITDVDGVLTDAGVYYSSEGEQLKRFSIRDGMGVERLHNICDVETAIITGETSGSVVKRAEKLKISKLFLGIKQKEPVLFEILSQYNLEAQEVAYIGDDVNDMEVMRHCGLKAAPADAMEQIKTMVDYVTKNNGGHGAFREFAELIIHAKTKK
jgi:3-deoxy-D-manno-octulosonate 8-phosphate phosphatase (KDO 8-P phosphatase)